MSSPTPPADAELPDLEQFLQTIRRSGLLEERWLRNWLTTLRHAQRTEFISSSFTAFRNGTSLSLLWQSPQSRIKTGRTSFSNFSAGGRLAEVIVTGALFGGTGAGSPANAIRPTQRHERRTTRATECIRRSPQIQYV